MATHISAVDARRSLGHLLNIVVLRQEEVIIERSGKPVARLTGFPESGATSDGRLDFRRSRGLGKALWQTVSTEAYLNEERSAWD